EDIISGANRIEKALISTLKKMKASSKKEKLIEVIENDIDRLKNLEYFQEMYKYIGFFYENPASLLDYLPSNGLIILDEMSRIQEVATNLDKEEGEWYSSLLASNQMVNNSKFSYDWHTVWDRMV